MKITSSGQLPGVTFYSHEALREFVHEALAIEAARQEFEQSGDETIFWDEMQRLGCDRDEIVAAIANPKARPAIGYGCPV